MKLTNWFHTKSEDPRLFQSCMWNILKSSCEYFHIWCGTSTYVCIRVLNWRKVVVIEITKSLTHVDHLKQFSIHSSSPTHRFSFDWILISQGKSISYLCCGRHGKKHFEIRFNCGSGEKTNCMLILFTILLCIRKECEDFMRWNKPLLIFNYMMILPIDTHNLFHRNLLTSRQIVNEKTFFIQTLLKREQCSSYVKIYEMHGGKQREHLMSEFNYFIESFPLNLSW